MVIGKRLLPVLCLCLLFLGACGNRQEIDDVAVVLGVAIDGNEDEYQLTVELAAPKAPDDLGEGVFFVTEGTSLEQAVDELNHQLEKELFWGHLQVIMIGDPMLPRLMEICEYFHSLRQLATSSLIIAAKGNAGEMVQQGFGQADYASFGIAESVRLLQTKSLWPNLRFVMENLQKNRKVDLPYLELVKIGDDTRLAIITQDDIIKEYEDDDE